MPWARNSLTQMLEVGKGLAYRSWLRGFGCVGTGESFMKECSHPTGMAVGIVKIVTSFQSPYWPQKVPLECSRRSHSVAPEDWARSEERGYGLERGLYSGYQEKRVMGATMHGPGPRCVRVSWGTKGALEVWGDTTTTKDPSPVLASSDLSPSLSSGNEASVRRLQDL